MAVCCQCHGSGMVPPAHRDDLRLERLAANHEVPDDSFTEALWHPRDCAERLGEPCFMEQPESEPLTIPDTVSEKSLAPPPENGASLTLRLVKATFIHSSRSVLKEEKDVVLWHRPLDFSFAYQLPVVINRTGKHASDAGIHVGWTLVEFNGIKVGSDFGRFLQDLEGAVKVLPERPPVAENSGDCMMLRFRKVMQHPSSQTVCSETRDVQVRQRPLDMSFGRQMPLVVSKVAGHAADVGIPVGWTLVELDGRPVEGDYDNFFAEFSQALFRLPLYELPLVFNANGRKQTVVARCRPLGMSFTQGQLPLVITRSEGHAREIGIQEGWTLLSFAGEDVGDSYPWFLQHFQRKLQMLPS